MIRCVVLGILAAGCAPREPACASGSTSTRVFAVDRMILPQQRSDFAVDLNGDGDPDNQLGSLIGAVTGASLDAQSYVDLAFAMGQQPMQLELFSDDQGHMTAILSDRHSGNADGVFCGTRNDAQLVSPDPATARAPVEMMMTLGFADDVTVHLTAARIDVEQIESPHPTVTLEGAVRYAEVRSVVITGMADLLTKKMQIDPNSTLGQQIAQLFDVGDDDGGACTNLDDTRSMPHDGVIGWCEVANNSAVKAVLVPDVELFDKDGHWHPSPMNAHKDSLSVAVQLTTTER